MGRSSIETAFLLLPIFTLIILYIISKLTRRGKEESDST